MTNQDAPIACTLGGVAYGERVKWIARLNREGLRSHRRDATSLELLYTVAVRDQVHELARKEAACCAFLEFRIAEAPGGVCLTITAPERARDVADALFEPFLPAIP